MRKFIISMLLLLPLPASAVPSFLLWRAGSAVTTTAITGATAIDDNWIRWDFKDNNNGGNEDLGIGNTCKMLIRINPGNIPAGTITGFRVYIAKENAGGTSDVDFYLIKAANIGWGEGDKTNAAADAGESDWNHVLHNTQSWAGSIGCATEGTDYVADASPPGWTESAGGAAHEYYSTSLPVAWAEGFRDGTGEGNTGIVALGTSTLRYYHSVDHATYPLYFEVDTIP